MTAQTDSYKFAAYLGLDEETNQWHLRSIDISEGGILHTITYPDLPLLRSVLIDSLCDDILSQLSEMNRSGEMISKSDYVLEVAGVQFQKLRVHTNFSIARGVEASFWFASFTGQPLLALRQYAEDLATQIAPDQLTEVAVQAIDRVVLPALNVVAAVRSGLRTPDTIGAFEDHTGRLVQEADTLIKYAELVKWLLVSAETADISQVLLGQVAPAEQRAVSAF